MARQKRDPKTVALAQAIVDAPFINNGSILGQQSPQSHR